jgi:hypothetical protein
MFSSGFFFDHRQSKSNSSAKNLLPPILLGLVEAFINSSMGTQRRVNVAINVFRRTAHAAGFPELSPSLFFPRLSR